MQPLWGEECELLLEASGALLVAGLAGRLALMQQVIGACHRSGQETEVRAAATATLLDRLPGPAGRTAEPARIRG